MSKLSFKTFCIEHYAEYTNQAGNEIYQEFKRAGLLNLLDEDYDDLHGMSIEWLLQYFDRYLGVEKETHSTVRALILPDIIKYIAEEFDWTEDEALDRFYNSRLAISFADDEMGLYGQSPLFIASLFRQEMAIKSKI